MLPWQLIDSAPLPGEKGGLALYRRGGDFSLRLGGSELMNSRRHGSEEAMARLACGRIASLPAPRVLVGGLGMGFTLAAALAGLGAGGRVVVAELLPAVVAWNRGPLADLAGRPLADGRVTVRQGDVAQLLRAEPRAYDAVLLDVDNGPRGLTCRDNDGLYSRAGLDAAFAALRPGGVFALWSAGPDRGFAGRLAKAGFTVEEVRVPARGRSGGGRHRIWIGRRPAGAGTEGPPPIPSPGDCP